MPILVGSGLSKISISLLLLRLLGDAAGRMRKYFLHGINIFVIMYTLIDIISDVAACKPLAKVWDLEMPGKCRSPHSEVSVVYFQGGSSSPELSHGCDCLPESSLRISGLFTAFRSSCNILRQITDAFTHESRAVWPHQPRDLVRKHRQISATSYG